MKKFGLGLLCSMLLMISSFVFMACDNSNGEVTLSKINTNLSANYLQTDTIDFENFELTLVYSDKSTKKIEAGVVEFDIDVDSAAETTQYIVTTKANVENVPTLYNQRNDEELTIGTYTIKVIVLEINKTFDVGTITISSSYEVVSFGVPAFVNTFTINNETSTTDESKFYQTAGYTVGDDNEFIFKPVLKLRNANDVEFTAQKFSVDVSVTYEGEDASDYYTFNEETFGLKFNEAGEFIATGKTFILAMSLQDYDEDAEGDDIAPLTFTFTVADGWNATSALDLGRMNIMSDSMTDELYANYLENATNDQSHIWLDSNNIRNQSMNYSNLWKNFIATKTGVAPSEVKHINGLFIHGDINVTTSDFPAEYLISSVEATGEYAASVGSFRDGAQLYNYYMENDFTMNGNLFTINLSQVPLCLNNKDSSTGGNYYYTANQATFFPSHTAAFAFMEKKDMKENSLVAGDSIEDTTHVANVVNFHFIGNSIPSIVTLDDNATTEQKFDVLKYSGGLIGVKSFSTTTNVSNCISNRFMISWYSDNLGAKYNATTIDYCKTYDSFNSGFFSFRATNNYVNNSEFKRFGGPAMLLICGNPQDNGTSNGPKYFSEMTVDTNTVIESYVTGQEPWFVMMNSTTTATAVKNYVEPVVNTYGNNTIITDNKMNMKVLIMMDDYLGADVPAYGKFTQGDFVFNTEPSETNPTYLVPWGTGAPFYIDASGHFAAYSGQNNGDTPIMINPTKQENDKGYAFVKAEVNGSIVYIDPRKYQAAFQQYGEEILAHVDEFVLDTQVDQITFSGDKIGFNINLTGQAGGAPVLGMVFEMNPITQG